MSPRKLTEADKQDILKLYRNSEATTSTLATQFGVSSSTVSRFLKNSLSQIEYEELIQQKRLARTTKGESKTVLGQQEADSQENASPVKQLELVTSSDSSLQEKSPKPQLIISHTPRNTETLKEKSEAIPSSQSKASLINKQPIIKESIAQVQEEDEDDDLLDVNVDVIALQAMLGEEIEDDDLDDDDDEDDDDDDDWESEEESFVSYPHTTPSETTLKILPLAEASIPKICYLVVDRAAELIVKPLQDFADLGSIPAGEIQQKTLPVFDNHRVAKRFSHRREKVIKVPDGNMLQKTSRYLYNKGITRLLIEGQIYAISLDLK